MRQLLYLFIFISPHLVAQQSPFVVELAAFAEPVSSGHFGSIEKVYETLDANYIYRYYIDAPTKAAAEETKNKVKEAGFVNARIIDFNYLKENCEITCQYVPPKKTGKEVIPFNANPAEYIKIEHLHCIFFDFDKANIRQDAKVELDKIATILKQNRNYQLQILAHTDARGSLEYNRALSNRRAAATQNYLSKSGISTARMRKKTFGESTPIALNELSNGEDTEMGRQFNRRVEFRILDEHGNLLNVVDKIYVPEKIQNK